MSDKLYPTGDSNTFVRFKTMGDGSHAEVVYCVGDGTAEATLAQIRDRLPPSIVTPGLLPVDTLGTPGAPRVQATSGAAASVVLTSTCRRVSMYATQGTWYSISGNATTASHYIAPGERLDFDVPANTTISVLQETSAGSIRITELT